MVRGVLAENAGCLDEVTDPRFVEWDLLDSNVMIRDGTIVSIIDHERAFYGDPLIEGGFAAIQLPAFGDPAAFMRGYGRGELTETERARRRLYCLHLALIRLIGLPWTAPHGGELQPKCNRAMRAFAVPWDSTSLWAHSRPEPEAAGDVVSAQRSRPSGSASCRDGLE